MQVSNLNNQIVEILEKKYGHSIDEDDPLMLTITAQTLVTEHLLELHKENMKIQFEDFQERLLNITKQAKVDSTQSKQLISEYVRKAFLSVLDDSKAILSDEFIRAGQELEKAKKWHKKTKFWGISTVLICCIILSASFYIAIAG